MDSQDPDRVKIVVVRPPPPSTATDFFSQFEHTETEDGTLPRWTLSEFDCGLVPISAKLGFPLTVTTETYDESKPFPKDQPPNVFIELLFTNPDLSIPKVGSPVSPPFGGRWRGGFMVARCDGKDLSGGLLSYLAVYIMGAFAAVPDKELFLKLPRKMQDSIRADIAQKINRKAFATAYEEHRQQQLAEGNQLFLDPQLECPVKIDESDSCELCGAANNPAGMPLLACARCKKVRYCGKDCQRANWKEHKKVCKEPDKSKAAAAST